ncbi:MAG: 30S ribosome-binding factor RbfA [Candidatus Palauibacterales bacterium]|jgi:ribosome-binding factor A|nr:30S ribosome-binding factor RbfA [Candidatus Palauibacterales bacterium]MDP2482005.1 30S ribosome-binding factor RbfA [Candidatus Palauibacterales bacterium]
MPSNRRTIRLNQLLREELASLLQTEIKDPRVRSVTVTRVEATQDLAYADVYVRTLTDEIPVEEAIAGLESAEGFVRRRLGRELHLRRIPDFRFHADRALEHVRRIDALLDEALGSQGDDGGD